MMDGLAVMAADTLGASIYEPRPLRIIGDSYPGAGFANSLSSGVAVRIMTGAPMPIGADAVLPAEKVRMDLSPLADRCEAIEEVPPQKNVSPIGEDFREGDEVVVHGRKLRPQDLGVLSAFGFETVSVYRRPSVRLVVTGNELLPAGSKSTANVAQIFDANGPMLEALIRRDGGVPIHAGIVPDREKDITTALWEAADITVVSGGSSVGLEDHAPGVLAKLGELAIHGVAMRPSSPTGMGRIGNRLVFLLPGNPVSCLCAYDFFVGPILRYLSGYCESPFKEFTPSRPIPNWSYRSARYILSRKLVSTVGRVDYARVQYTSEGVEPIAISGASLLSSVVKADGFVVVPQDLEGYPGGSEVEVFLYD